MPFHQEDAMVHTCVATLAKFNELSYNLLPHPLCSPDLDPVTIFYPDLKKWVCAKRLGSNDKINAQRETYLENLNESFYIYIYMFTELSTHFRIKYI